MLKNTFLHIPGIGAKTEKQLWDAGIYCWEDFTPHRPVRLSPTKCNIIFEYLKESKHRIESNDPAYFADRLPSNQHWRYFPEFRAATVYLDIETTGLNRFHDPITTIALYNGKSIYHYVNGQNLDDFLDEIFKYKVIVTYNGKTFDVPFIENYFRIRLDHAHIDLRYILGSLGFRGGLKSCEIQLGIDRGDLREIDGFFAVQLWHDYQRTRDPRALETLLAYNIQDVLTLENLMVMAYNLKINETPFYANQLPAPVLPEIPFAVDLKTVDRIKRYFWAMP